MTGSGFRRAWLAAALALAPAVATAAAGDLLLAQAGSIRAPSTVDPGASVMVTVPDARTTGRIELWGPVTQSGRGSMIDRVPAAGSVSFVAPSRPGSYELRHVGPGGEVLARTTLDVAAVPVTLSVPEKMSAGIEARVRWRGPAEPGDALQIVNPATGIVLEEVPAVGVPGDETETVMPAPDRTGEFHLRYWSASRNAALRSLPVEVVSGNAWLRMPIAARRGERFEVQWKGPVGESHAFRIVDPLTDTVIGSQPGAAEATLVAPTQTGDYRIRYVNTETGDVLADLPLNVGPR